jgi:hypothetical protein
VSVSAPTKREIVAANGRTRDATPEEKNPSPVETNGFSRR